MAPHVKKKRDFRRKNSKKRKKFSDKLLEINQKAKFDIRKYYGRQQNDLKSKKNDDNQRKYHAEKVREQAVTDSSDENEDDFQNLLHSLHTVEMTRPLVCYGEITNSDNGISGEISNTSNSSKFTEAKSSSKVLENNASCLSTLKNSLQDVKVQASLESLESDSEDGENGGTILQCANILNDAKYDFFHSHFETLLTEEQAKMLSGNDAWSGSQIKLLMLGNAKYSCVCAKTDQLAGLPIEYKFDIQRENIKKTLLHNLPDALNELSHTQQLSQLQEELFYLLNRYYDVLYPEETLDTLEQIRTIYSLHALNHVLKTRSRILHHNNKLSKRSEVPDEYRDHGLTRPKVLILVPFRESALRIVNAFCKLLLPNLGQQSLVTNRKRFQSEYGTKDSEKDNLTNKPEDYSTMFAGNIDDCFKIGIAIGKKSLKLYCDFYSADIIIASPLGLRILVGTEEDKERDFDFLSSIEIMIIDQAHVLLMQNWDHVLHIVDHMHLQPKDAHGTDFSRVRMWALNGWSQFYRQTLMFSGISAAELISLFNKRCHNFTGKLQICNPVKLGSICRIVIQLPQVFHKISSSSFAVLADARFQFFVQKMLPHFKDLVMAQTLVYVPSYYDFVRLRNYFVKEEINCCILSEYTKEKRAAQAKRLFSKRKKHFMLFSERYHFFNRDTLYGIRHIIFYELPRFPDFYVEICNMIKLRGQADNISCTVMYSKYDMQRLACAVGTDRAQHMISSAKDVHLFVTGSERL